MPAPELHPLERELADHWSREQLAVYGDHLQSVGDPRGELIAIDLAGRPPESAARRAELEAAWLARLPAGLDHRSTKTDCGFLTHVWLFGHEALGAFFSSPFAHQLRSLTLREYLRTMVEAVDQFAGFTLPLLDHVGLVQGDPPSSTISEAAMAGLVAATPNLTSLSVDGRRVAGAIAHPHVRTLELVGLDAIVDFGALPWPALTRLDLAFHRSPQQDIGEFDEAIRTLLPPAQFPVLAELDLSRNERSGEPLSPRSGLLDPFAWLRGTKLPALARVRMPSLRSDEQVRSLTAAHVRTPPLEITLARAYPDSPAPPPGIAAPVARPWPPRDALDNATHMLVHIPGYPFDQDVKLVPAQELMEREFDAFTEDVREAWTEIWELYADTRAETLPTNVLVRALPPTIKLELYWGYLRDTLAQLQSRDALPEVVTIERQYGYGELP